MAIIYSYPEKTSPAGGDFLVITDSEQPAPNKNRTKSLTIDNLASYVTTSTSGITGSGTTNTLPVWTDGPNGVLGDSQLQQSLQLGSGLYQIRFNNADRFIINKPSSVTSGDPEYLIQQDGNFKVSFGWDDDGGGFGYIYNWAGNGLRLGAAGENPQFELETATPKIISHTDHEFEGAILDSTSSPGTSGQLLTSTASGVEWDDATDVVSGAVAKLIPFQVTALAGGSSTYSDNNNIVEFSWDNVNGNGIYVLTIPSAATIPYRNIRFVTNSTFPNGASDKVEITAQSGETIDGAAFFEISKQYEGVSLWSNGTEWIVIQAKAH
jgi:hypothetical protein